MLRKTALGYENDIKLQPKCYVNLWSISVVGINLLQMSLKSGIQVVCSALALKLGFDCSWLWPIWLICWLDIVSLPIQLYLLPNSIVLSTWLLHDQVLESICSLLHWTCWSISPNKNFIVNPLFEIGIELFD